MRHIFLYGPPGSGKTTVGRLLADSLDLPFVDLDKEIEKTAGRSIPDIMAELGETPFRDMESSELEKVSINSASVIALGGGTLLRDSSRLCAESSGTVVFLEADLPTLLGRLRTEADKRPLLAGNIEGKLITLLARRREHYDSFKLRITTKTFSPEDIRDDIQKRIGAYCVHGMGAPYDVVVESGGLGRLGEMLVERDLAGKLVVIADSNLSRLFGKKVQDSLQARGINVTLVSFLAGEQFKTLETISSLWRDFLKAGLDRKSTVVALGGGVTGDLAGFAASVYMRGIPWVGVPTSLLAMVDSSLGGKTGFDLPEGKNLIGAFHSPRLVLSDPETLSTLPEDELRSGLGEVVKHAIIADPLLYNLCGRNMVTVKADLPEIVCRAMAVKIKYIEADPYERGMRAALNLGHTVGHAVETVSGYRLKHGESVAIGLVVEARLSEYLGLASTGLSESIADTLMGLGLPVRIPPDLPRSEILRVMQFDKKKESGKIRFALPVDIGVVKLDVEIENLDRLIAEV